MNDDTDTAELPPIKRPSRWVDIFISLLFLAIIVFVCLSSSCGHSHV